MRSGVITASKAKRIVRFDDQHKLQIYVGYVAACQKAIYIYVAMVIDEDCMEFGIERLPTCVASSWNGVWRPPLYWVGSDHPTDCGTVLMYECRHLFEDGCELMPTSVAVRQ